MTFEEFVEGVREDLPAETAEPWIAMLRKGFRLRPASPGEPVVCRLGGAPRLPAATPWPEWPGHGPLTFVAEVDCSALPHGELDLAFPADGSLLFFYFDGQIDGRKALVTGGDESSQRGARVLYVGPGAEIAERSAPEGIEPFPGQSLAGDIVISVPDYGHPDASWVFSEPHAEWIFDPALVADVRALGDGPCHQIAGHARPIHGAVEPEFAPPARQWRLLAQFTTDGRSKMMWGDFGTLYWVITADDLAARRFDAARMTWECY